MQRSDHAARRRTAVILGTNETASAIAVVLHRAAYNVVMSQDDDYPVLRRKMSFYDALFNESAKLEQIRAERADNGVQIANALRHSDLVQVTWLGLPDLMPAGPIDLLIDARLQPWRVRPDLRRLARFSVGLGAGFVAAANCDAAVEVPDLGMLDAHCCTAAARGGRWHCALQIGEPIRCGMVVGHLDDNALRAPCAGVLRGVVRDGQAVAAGTTLLEIDPRGRHAQWSGIDDGNRAVARALMRTLETPLIRDVAAPVHAVPEPRFPA